MSDYGGIGGTTTGKVDRANASQNESGSDYQFLLGLLALVVVLAVMFYCKKSGKCMKNIFKN